jgi:dipeptidyl aminopeptidase/acylaminoacyl peptidase
MMKHVWAGLTLLLTLSLAACGGSSSSDDDSQQDDGDDGGDDGGEYSGTLIAAGTGGLHTLDLDSEPEDSDPWVTRDSESVYESTSVVPATNEVLVAGDSFGSPVTVAVIDLGTFGLVENFEWREDDEVGRVNGFAASGDGQHLAALLEALGPSFLEVLARDGREVVYSGLDLISNGVMAWTPDDRLVFAIDLSVEDDPDRWGAIGVIPLDRFYDATDANIDIDLVATFTRAEWEASGVSDIAVSRDGSQIVYTRVGDLWVMDLAEGATPHQLTTGAPYKGGAQFSPDGSAIAFAVGSSEGLKETYIIPNHRSDPLFITYGESGDEYLIGEETLVDRMLAWIE